MGMGNYYCTQQLLPQALQACTYGKTCQNRCRNPKSSKVFQQLLPQALPYCKPAQSAHIWQDMLNWMPTNPYNIRSTVATVVGICQCTGKKKTVETEQSSGRSYGIFAAERYIYLFVHPFPFLYRVYHMVYIIRLCRYNFPLQGISYGLYHYTV